MFYFSVEKDKQNRKELERKGSELAEGTKCWPVESLMMMEAKLTLELGETVWV